MARLSILQQTAKWESLSGQEGWLAPALLPDMIVE
jgi:hypothetical protein